jgi:drug/metabolite transporter (DMT)-like permease
MNRPSVIIPLSALVVIFGTLGQTMLKSAVNSLPVNSSLLDMASHLVRSGWFYAGVAFAGIGFVIWLFVLARADLSFATPFLALAFPMILLSSAYILHEPMSFPRIAGTLLVTVGMFMVAVS